MQIVLRAKELNKNQKELLENEFGELNTSKVVLFKERLEHIKDRHPEIVEILKDNFKSVVEDPDYILKDEKKNNTIWAIKNIKDKKLNLVIKLSLKNNKEQSKFLNSVITGHKLNDDRLEKYLKKNKLLYKNKK
ncbi:MAG: hypothetical protein CR959_00335 [Fusobacteriales bacterium]|nr:MAG: hypothetical protein CR959_00335 [Fusobacteriales bacterium]